MIASEDEDHGCIECGRDLPTHEHAYMMRGHGTHTIEAKERE